MILFGVVSWVAYTLGAKEFAGWSPLRYTTLTVGYGLIGIGASTALASASGLAHVPSVAQLVDAAPYFFYVIVFASVMAVLGWNEGVRRIGAVNGVLFINFVPITAFLIQALQGQPLHPIELAGAALVASALLLNNLLQRRSNRTSHAIFVRVQQTPKKSSWPVGSVPTHPTTNAPETLEIDQRLAP